VKMAMVVPPVPVGKEDDDQMGLDIDLIERGTSDAKPNGVS